jgi:hypothetical protein
MCEEDSDQDLTDLMKERAHAPGWEAWCTLLSERLKSLKDRSTPIHLENVSKYTEESSIFQNNDGAKSPTEENPLPSEIIKIKVYPY